MIVLLAVHLVFFSGRRGSDQNAAVREPLLGRRTQSHSCSRTVVERERSTKGVALRQLRRTVKILPLASQAYFKWLTGVPDWSRWLEL